MRPRPHRQLVTDEDMLAEILLQARSRGRPPTYQELGGVLTLGRSSVHDAMIRLRALRVLREEPRIALTPHAQLALGRVILGVLDPQEAARLLLYRPEGEPRASRPEA